MPAFPRSIHVHNGNSIIELHDKMTPVPAHILNGVCNQIRYQIFSPTGKLLAEATSSSKYSCYIQHINKNYSLMFARDDEALANRNFPDSSFFSDSDFFVLRCFVDDAVNDGCWHACYTAVLASPDAFNLLESKKKDFLSIFSGFVDLPQSNTDFSVRVLARNIVQGDAVSNFCMGLAGFLQHEQFSTSLYAHDNCLVYAGIVSPLGLYKKDISASDCMFYNYSIGDDFFPDLANSLAYRKVLFFHNVTPGQWFAAYDHIFAQRLDDALQQYPLFSQFDAVIANSQFSLDQIRPYLRPEAETLVFPPYFSLSRVQGAEEPVPAEFSARHSLLWVGRTTPHKRPELALRIADELVRSGVDISLTFVGGGRYDFPAFAQHLQACLEDLDPRTRERIRFLEGLTDEQLTWLYRHSDLLLCTSAHEGYCMPLAEAAACGLPVAAMPQPAVLETLNGGGIVLSEDPAGAAGQIATFLETADEAERRASIPVLKPLPTDALLRLIIGEK